VRAGDTREKYRWKCRCGCVRAACPLRRWMKGCCLLFTPEAGGTRRRYGVLGRRAGIVVCSEGDGVSGPTPGVGRLGVLMTKGGGSAPRTVSPRCRSGSGRSARRRDEAYLGRIDREGGRGTGRRTELGERGVGICTYFGGRGCMEARRLDRGACGRRVGDGGAAGGRGGRGTCRGGQADAGEREESGAEEGR